MKRTQRGKHVQFARTATWFQMQARLMRRMMRNRRGRKVPLRFMDIYVPNSSPFGETWSSYEYQGERRPNPFLNQMIELCNADPGTIFTDPVDFAATDTWATSWNKEAPQ